MNNNNNKNWQNVILFEAKQKKTLGLTSLYQKLLTKEMRINTLNKKVSISALLQIIK